MLKTTFLASSAVAVLLLATACGPTEQKQSQSQETQAADLAAKEAPTTAEQATAEAGNEVEQAAGPAVALTQEEIAAGLNGKDVPSPATTLSTAAVKTPAGEALGEVRSVVVGPDGKATAVIVEVGGFLNVGERGVSIDAAKFTYLKDRNILVVAVTKADVEQMPAVPATN